MSFYAILIIRGDILPTIVINENKIMCENGENLYTVLLRGGIQLNAPCGGNGTCGKCYVWIDGIGKRKACEYIVTNNITVSTKIPRSEIATKGMLRDVVLTNNEPCIAVDIGTTTVVVYALQNGEILDIESSMNMQKSFGDDVLTRIKFTTENQDGLQKLHNIIKKQIDEMFKTLCIRNSIETDNIVIVGNTTMLHLYANISPATIGVAPFTPVFTEMKRLGNTTLFPSFAGYVGGDIVSAILASGMHLSKEKSLLLDIGTNAEIAFGNCEKIVVCAAAAGPAFEGAQISSGIGGVAGAINSIVIDDKISYTTIDNVPPVGICGSGILDAVSQMLKAGIIDETGFFEDEELKITDNISVTAQDIREIQLAKAAIAAGIKTLLRETNSNLSDVENCYLAGGFGSYLNKQSACNIGLLPSLLIDKIKSIGNAAGMGAVLWQISDACKAEVQQIINITKYHELSGSSVFNEEFINCMLFE